MANEAVTELDKKIVEKFKKIRDIIDAYLDIKSRHAAATPNDLIAVTDKFIEGIGVAISEYNELIQPRWVIIEISRLLEEHGYEHRQGYSPLTREENHHFIMGKVLISMIVNEEADEETLETIRSE